MDEERSLGMVEGLKVGGSGACPQGAWGYGLVWMATVLVGTECAL